MTSRIIIIVLLIGFILSCENNQLQEPINNTPKALQEKKSYEIFSGRTNEDIIESLYKEALKNDIELQKLETTIAELNSSKKDSVELFENFNSKIQFYYRSANRLVAAIKDSTIRDEINNIVSSHQIKYNNLVSMHTNLLKTIEMQQMNISDLQNILKIIHTIPIIEEYQKNNIPDTQPMEEYRKLQYEVIREAKKLTEK